MYHKVFIILLAVLAFGCVSKREFSVRQKPMCSYSNVAYVGTFSSVSVIKNKEETLFNDSLTAFANYMYDSVIRSKVRNIVAVNTISYLSSTRLKSLTEELTRNVLNFDRINGVSLSNTSVIDSVARLYENRYSSYFVDFGNIWSKKQNRKYFAGQTLLVSAVIIGFAVLVVLAGTNGGDLDFIDTSGNRNSSNTNEHWYGMNCYYVIYDKQEKKLCYLKNVFFNSDKTDNYPFNALRVSGQVDIIFNTCLNTN